MRHPPTLCRLIALSRVRATGPGPTAHLCAVLGLGVLACASPTLAQETFDANEAFQKQLEEINKARDKSIEDIRESLGINDMMAAADAAKGELPDPAVVAERLLERFKDVCGQALEDRSTYLSDLPDSGPADLPVWNTSPDGKVTSVQVARDDVIEDVEFVDLPGQTLTQCIVHDIDVNRVMALGAGSTDQSAIGEYNARLAQAFGDAVEATDDTTLIGGRVQLAPPEIIAGEGLYSSFQGTMMWPTIHHRFGVVLPLAGEPRIAYAELMAGASWMGTFLVEKGNE